MRVSSIIICSSIFLFTFSVSVVHAQSSQTGVAVPVVVNGTQPEDGDVICTGKGGYVLCSDNYSTAIFGVMSKTPAAAFEAAPQPNQYLVLTNGRALVRVSGQSGAIKRGDLLTSSTKPGIAQRASENGYVIGMALEDFTPQNSNDIEKISISLDIHPTTIFIDVRSNLLEALREGLSAPILTPLAALRYILAAFVTIASFILGFIHFGRLAKTGIEAIGRNPMARLQIQSSVLVNLVLMAVIFGGGMALSYFILVL